MNNKIFFSFFTLPPHTTVRMNSVMIHKYYLHVFILKILFCCLLSCSTHLKNKFHCLMRKILCVCLVRKLMLCVRMCAEGGIFLAKRCFEDKFLFQTLLSVNLCFAIESG